jgi:hypothetical protein
MEKLCDLNNIKIGASKLVGRREMRTEFWNATLLADINLKTEKDKDKIIFRRILISLNVWWTS